MSCSLTDVNYRVKSRPAMDIWIWKWWRLAWCKRDYDEVISWQHLFWRLWLRKSARQLFLEQVEREQRSAETLVDDWWEQRKRDAVAESAEASRAIEELYGAHNWVTELECPNHIPIPDTLVVQPQMP